TLPRGPLPRPRARSVWSASDLSALFARRGTATGSWSQCTRKNERKRSMGEVTRILNAVQQGDSKAAEELIPLVYEDLRKPAAHKLANEAPGQTLQPTALVHEAWLRLVGNEEPARFQNRAHFFGAAAEAMRRILIERARRRKVLEKGGFVTPEECTESKLVVTAPSDELLAVHAALDSLAAEDTVAADLVK